ncbi:MAG TPA: CDF family Co(II)/Ni(II) efflux transporter DmeF [Burkholderiaceae bacterium]|nr:CDF family Co(II)/Ni(II) efflux transporter DmeF [Burkholderiaceae bacterium]
MHTGPLAPSVHDHVFHSASADAERGTRLVLWITLVTMVIEIAAGYAFNSMALLADGWHMSSHAVAIGMSVLAYTASRRYASDPRFAFGTWKIEVLGGYTSALLLLGVAGVMVWGSVERLLSPQGIHYPEAISVAALGLIVNLGCAVVLMRAGGGHGHHHHGHGHTHADHHGHNHNHHSHHDHEAESPTHTHHHHAHQHDDLNLKSAYVHVVADAATSVLAILALAGGWMAGWIWLDPAMGLVGAVLVARWSVGLLRETSAVLLDREMHHPIVAEIRDAIEMPADPQRTEISDLHVWRVGPRAYTCALTVVTHDPTLSPQQLRERIEAHEEIVHSTIEVHVCPGCEG